MPGGLEEPGWNCWQDAMFSVIMGHLGNDVVAANSIANIVKNIIACVCLGIGTGSGIILFGSPLILRAAGNLTSQAHVYLEQMLLICSY